MKKSNLFFLLSSLLLWGTSSYVPIRSKGIFFDFRSRSIAVRSSTQKQSPTNPLTDLMVDLWKAVVYPPEDVTGKEFVLDDYQLNRNQVKGFLNHFQFCKDCALDNSFLMATQNSEGKDSLYLSYVSFPLLSDDEADDESWGNFDPSLLIGKNDVTDDKTNQQQTIFPIEDDNQIVLHDTKFWVEKVIAQFGVCPFTIDSNRAGIPLGGVRYRVARATTPEEAFLFFWEEVQLLMQVKEKEVSTTLLVFPEIELFGNYELFEFYCECLNDALSASSLNLESDMQLVFFHPKYNFRDGKDRIMSDNDKNPAATSCLNYARRSPWPMINILRSNQVKAAQKGIPTGLVYQQNDERLSKVGSDVLQDMLVNRNWKSMPIIEEGRMKLNPSDDKEKKAINLQNPVLTSFSPAVKSCPFHSSIETIPNKSIINDDKNNDFIEDHDTSVDGSIDYLKFADEVEKWMNEEM